MEQLSSHRTDYLEILYFNILQKPVEKFQVWLAADKNNGYFT
jgi:hypothetical protein